jgi:hypothetical protein
MGSRFKVLGSEVGGFEVQRRRRPKKTAGLIEKKTNERRTSNTRTSNIEYCILSFFKRLGKASLPFENLRFGCFKIDKAQRHQYWMFDVGRSMFDVQFFSVTDQRPSVVTFEP